MTGAVASDTHADTASSSARRPSFTWRWSRHAGLVVLGLALVRALTPGIGGIVTNDSVGYLGRSYHPFSAGFVVQGYRQAAYPLGIHLIGWLDHLFGFDTIFAVAFTQRMLLLVGLVLAWQALRWWSVPILIVATSATYVLHTDYVLMEGFLVPACLIAGAMAASMATGAGRVARHPRLAVIALTVVGTAMGAVKLQYASTLVLAAAAAWIAVQAGQATRRFAVLTVAVGAALMCALAGAQAVENHHELGSWEPVGERARAEWYGAWYATFKDHPENARRPELAQYWNHGDLYEFMHGVEATEPDYATRQREMRARVAAMFAAAGTTRRDEELDAFWGAIQGGRSDDIAAITDKVRRASTADHSVRLTFNALSAQGGPELVEHDVNRRRPTGFFTIASVTSRTQSLVNDYRPARATLGIVGALLALVGLALRGRHRVVCAATTLCVVSVSATLATAYIDNARYLVGPMTISLFGATLGLRAVVLAIIGGKRGAVS